MTERFGKSSTELQRWYLKEWRKYRGMTQEQLADEIDSTKQTISRMESGTRPYNQPFLEACAEALNCHPADLLFGPPAEATSNDRKKLNLVLEQKSDNDISKIIQMISLMGN